MKQGEAQFSKIGFAGRYVLPLFMIFLIPAISLVFFTHVESSYDAKVLAAVERGIHENTNSTEAEKARVIEKMRATPISQVMASRRPETKPVREWFQSHLTASAARDYFMFRWIIRIAKFCIVTGILGLAIAAISVLVSLRSQVAQYWSLLTGWHVLRLFATVQVAAQGLMAFALSYWVPVFYAQLYSPKLVLLIGLMFVVATFVVIVAVFKRPDMTFPVEGRVLDEENAGPLMEHLAAVATNLGIEKPNQIIAGIDDNFFVTEHTVNVGERRVEGKTLFVSLALLRNITREEANAVLAHEMAHFSGSDTVYSKKISPLLSRYFEYMKALYAGGVSRPVFYFMFAFWSLYQLSIQRLSRQREFRADSIAAQQTSPLSLANALIKISAFSRYRAKVEMDTFNTEEVLEDVNIPAQVSEGFTGFVRECIAEPDLGESTTAHPFDSHPQMKERLAAVGLGEMAIDEKTLLAPVVDSWYGRIPGAEKIESELWQEYQNEFMKAHELSLAYRYMPANEQEAAIVLKHFPGVEFIDKKGNKLVINHMHAHFSKWEGGAIAFDEMTECTSKDGISSKYIAIAYTRDGNTYSDNLPLSGFNQSAEELMEHFKNYYARHLASREFKKEKEAEMAGVK